MLRRKNDAESREFWARIGQIVAEVDSWPKWKRDSVVKPVLDIEEALSEDDLEFFAQKK